MILQRIREMSFDERRAVMDKLAASLSRKADYAGQKGNEALEMVMRSVATAMKAAGDDIAEHDIRLAEDVVAKALSLILTFRCIYPENTVVTVH